MLKSSTPPKKNQDSEVLRLECDRLDEQRWTKLALSTTRGVIVECEAGANRGDRRTPVNSVAIILDE